eukprot:TRINITY_DN55070_c0_g1_i1.p1 TRINITY_DN55070_c0_g1~~TRINITY_DN55070_c0_g1_i1.p1  ORF type:complete len:403 (+),score=59.35 TRINITY_DN55070_c0_g1_i1:320-1528(+)
MATFKTEMVIPACGCLPPSRASAVVSWLAPLLGGQVVNSTRGCTPCLVTPTHAWSEIELPKSRCYLMLGGQTSAFRDRADSAFRLVLHDTTYRHWSRERGSLSYRGLLLHDPITLSAAHRALLRAIILHGDRPEFPPNPQDSFERATDQDTDLSPIFLELPPVEFEFTDRAVAGMITAYTRTFWLYRMSSFLLGQKPGMNCVVTALLFGYSPSSLLRLSTASHNHTRARAAELNHAWERRIGPMLSEARGFFRERVVEDQPGRPWWRRLLGSGERWVQLSFQQQIDWFGEAYIMEVLSPLKQALVQMDAGIEAVWESEFRLVNLVLNQLGDQLGAELAQVRDGCDAESIVEQLLFCPDWRETRFWQQRSLEQELSGGEILKQTEIAIRKMVYWRAAHEIRRS